MRSAQSSELPRGRSSRRRGQILAAVALIAAIGLGTTACTTVETNRRSAATDSSAAEGSSAETTETPAFDDGDATPGTLPPPLPNTVSEAPSKVLRSDQPEEPSVSADSVAFSAPVTYSDNTVLTITGASKQVETGNGPGVFSGREFVKFELELANGSGEPIDLNSVVVTAYYGDTNQLAAPVYTPSAETADFTGTLDAGGKATASYGFAVPTSELGNVTMVVDFDATHSSATFTGAVNIA